MITPRFSCSQTASAVIVRTYVPAVRASDVEMHVDGTLFSLHINPYFLRLVFSGNLVEDDASSAVYDPASGYLTVSLSKASPGEEFKDLDVLAKLLAPPKRSEPVTQTTIEVIDSQSAHEGGRSDAEGTESMESLSLDRQAVLEAAENDWHVPQSLPEDIESHAIQISTERRYGFLNAYSKFFIHAAYTENEVNELGSDAEALSESERRPRRLKHENEKWDEEHYIADYADDEYIREIISFEFPADSPCSSRQSNPLPFTEEENLAMMNLPRKEYLVTPSQSHNLYLTLLTVLFSYAYDARTTQCDPTPESAWTIASLTAAFSALDPPPYSPPTVTPLIFTLAELQNTLVPSIRRSLSFPLFRAYALAITCVRDVSVILRNGKRAVLRALLETKKILDHHEVYYVYSKVWVDDFCRWVANDISEDIFSDLGDKLHTLQVDKRSIGWDLLQLEAAVQREMHRQPDSDDESLCEGDSSDEQPASSASPSLGDSDSSSLAETD